MPDSKNKTPNSLIHETSPYLLQHAYNPVNWLPFSKRAFDLAKKENKPILISIGYSACHWCHVMEHESFENAEVAELMNQNYINIKVDREERSDVDLLYMQAVQMMTGHGGWPLNCFVLPDGKPFYGGTYFRKDQWLNVLNNLSDIYQNEQKKVLHYAEELSNGIKKSELILTKKPNAHEFNRAVLRDSITRWKSLMDNEYGGPNRAPKFPLPNNYVFLLRYAVLENDLDLLKHVNLTLTKMAFGGICDQLHGGFARYSTDIFWKVPHFEKMLYDNSQLASLYCEAYVLTKNELYKEVALDILNFVEKEWYQREGYFYSAYDADSDGEEGKYYVWTETDLKDILQEEYGIFSKYYEINKTGYWEHDNYILMRSEKKAQILMDYSLNPEQLDSIIKACKVKLKQESKSRIKPGLDDKTITSWNAMMCTAYAKAYLAFGNENHKQIAISSVQFILKFLVAPHNKLLRTYKNGSSKINGFLEDYAFSIEALLHCYLISQDELYLQNAADFCELCLKLFENPDSELLFYTDSESSELIARTTEISDNVMPSSNSQMALNLFYLGKYLDKEEWSQKAERMLKTVSEELKNYGSGYSNWGCLGLHLTYPFNEIAIVGKHVDEKLKELYQLGITNAIFALNANASDFPLVKNRYVEAQTLIYVCENGTCQLPVSSVEEALKQLA